MCTVQPVGQRSGVQTKDKIEWLLVSLAWSFAYGCKILYLLLPYHWQQQSWYACIEVKKRGYLRSGDNSPNCCLWSYWVEVSWWYMSYLKQGLLTWREIGRYQDFDIPIRTNSEKTHELNLSSVPWVSHARPMLLLLVRQKGCRSTGDVMRQIGIDQSARVQRYREAMMSSFVAGKKNSLNCLVGSTSLALPRLRAFNKTILA